MGLSEKYTEIVGVCFPDGDEECHDLMPQIIQLEAELKAYRELEFLNKGVEQGWKEYYERMKAERDALIDLGKPIAHIIRPGRHRLSIVIDEETTDSEKDALMNFFDHFKKLKDGD